MTLVEILQDFKGSQDGVHVTIFTAGERAELSDYLISCVNPAWISIVGKEIIIENKAIITEGKKGKKQ